jgi:hypothetical protein
MFGNPGPGIGLIGPLSIVVLAIATFGFVVGGAWLWRITRGTRGGWRVVAVSAVTRSG